jgi:ribosome-associated heat shock protein Hsp15
MNDSSDTVRLDKWLWAARFFKTRSSAAKAITGGKVQVNGHRPKRSSPVRAGDRVRIRRGLYEYHIVVRKLSEHRGPAEVAQTLYEETTESIRGRERMRLHKRAQPTFSFRDKGRPSKKERRQLRRLKGKPVDD